MVHLGELVGDFFAAGAEDAAGVVELHAEMEDDEGLGGRGAAE